jgi:hypothetical protein
VGVPDDLNKGLGFEKATLCENLEEFTDAELNILKNLRDQLTQFILKLGSKYCDISGYYEKGPTVRLKTKLSIFQNKTTTKSQQFCFVVILLCYDYAMF